MQTPDQLLNAALAKIETLSIKEWVEKQRSIWIKHCVIPLQARHGDDVDRLVVAIVSEAIGL